MTLYWYSCKKNTVMSCVFFSRASAKENALNRPIFNNFQFTKYSFKDSQNIIMFCKANFHFIPYMFLNQIGGKQQESKLHIKLHMSSKYISPHSFLSHSSQFQNVECLIPEEVFDIFFVINIICMTCIFINSMQKKVCLHDQIDEKNLFVSAFL